MTIFLRVQEWVISNSQKIDSQEKESEVSKIFRYDYLPKKRIATILKYEDKYFREIKKMGKKILEALVSFWPTNKAKKT